MSFSFSQLPNWEEVQVGGHPQWMRIGRSNGNYLQFSLNENMSGKRLEPPLDPQYVGEHLIARMESHPEVSNSGQCQVGRYCRTVFSTPRLAHGEVWILTDEYSVGVATFCCDEAPTAEELDEVARMVMSMTWPNPLRERPQ
jgi:hypothetical protein